MQYRRLGRTGLGVSPVCLGTMGFGPPTEFTEAERLVHAAAELGVNFIDTANCYDGPQRSEVVQGQAETMLGQILAGSLREEFVLLSKVGVPLRDGPQNRGLSSTHIVRELERSLRRLRTDYLDVYMIHWPDSFAVVEEVLRTIERVAQSGKVRHFGISNHSAWQVCEYLWVADRRGWQPPAVSEVPLNLLDRQYENDLPFYSRHDIGVLAYQPLKGGRLSERRTVESPPGSAGEADAGIARWAVELTSDEMQMNHRLEQVAQSAGMRLSELAIAWASSREAVVSIVLGARTREQLAAGAKAVEQGVSVEHQAAIDAICPGPPQPISRFER